VLLWDTASGQQVFRLQGASRTDYIETIRTLAWSADGLTLAVGDTVGHVRLWSAAPRSEEVQAARRAAWPPYARAWHRRAADDSEREHRWFATAFHLTRLLDGGQADGSLSLRRGLALARAERWNEAAPDFTRAIARDRIETFEVRYRHALLLRHQGDRAGFRAAADFLMQRWGHTRDPGIARRLLQARLLDPDRAVDRKALLDLFHVLLGKGKMMVVNGAGGWRDTPAYADVLKELNDPELTKDPKARPVWLYLPLLCQRLGDSYPARFWLGRSADALGSARQHVVQRIEGRVGAVGGEEVSWDDLLALDLLRGELEALLGKKAAGNR
jgi:hypothetical protein